MTSFGVMSKTIGYSIPESSPLFMCKISKVKQLPEPELQAIFKGYCKKVWMAQWLCYLQGPGF